MSPALLTADELADLTGYVRVSDQERALRKLGITPLRTRRGLRVTWEAVHRAMTTAAAAPAAAAGPNWQALA